jgi:hypothetical protein
MVLHLISPNGNTRIVETGWIYNVDDEFPKFVNAIPEKI